MPSPLAVMLIQDEMFDLALYRSLRRFAKNDTAEVLDGFIATEIRHLQFWRDFFAIKEPMPLSLSRRVRLSAFTFLGRVGGTSAIMLLLEAIEVHGVKKYLHLWQHADDVAFRDGVRTILEDELLHEDEAISTGGRKIDATTVRNAFLGFNDGSVEILGAVNGLAAAFGDPIMVAASGLTVSVAGALSMATGAYLSADSEREILETEAGKKAFLEKVPAERVESSPLRAAALVGTSYLIGAAVPVAPFLLGASNPWISIVLSGALILIVSAMLSFLSGMHIARRIALNGALLAASVFIAYGIGVLVDRVLLAHV